MFGSTANVAELHTIGNRVRVAGDVGIFNVTTIEILNLTEITLSFTYTFCGPGCELLECAWTSNLYINSERECTVAAEAVSWTSAKALYR